MTTKAKGVKIIWRDVAYFYIYIYSISRFTVTILIYNPLCPYLSSLSMILRAVTISVGSLLTDIRVLCIITHSCLPSCSDKLITSRKYFSRVCRQKKNKNFAVIFVSCSKLYINLYIISDQ